MMTRHRRCWHGILVGVLVLTLVVPFPAWSTATSLGTARGIRGVELSLDGGKSWLPLGGRSLPILESTAIRSTTGGAWLEFADGSRLQVLPFSHLRIREAGRTVEVSMAYGRLAFRLPATTRVEVRTAAARLEPAGKAEVLAGELLVMPDGTTGLKMAEGRLAVQELAGRQRTLLAALEPVFLPKRPETPGPFFSSEGVPAPPADAKGVYTTQGESLGYLRPDARLVVHPGFTADLTQPFPPKLVQLAMAQVPEQHRSEAMPLFDVQGWYVGYIAGPAFYAQAQVAQAVEGAPPPPPFLPGWTLFFLGLSLFGPVVFGATDGFGTLDFATPLRPRE